MNMLAIYFNTMRKRFKQLTDYGSSYLGQHVATVSVNVPILLTDEQATV
jgi:hypothetical protein